MTHEEYLSGLRERLKAARIALGASLREAAKLTGVTFNAIARIERGKIEPSTGVLFKLAKGYGIPFESLVCGRPPEPKKK